MPAGISLGLPKAALVARGPISQSHAPLFPIDMPPPSLLFICPSPNASISLPAKTDSFYLFIF